MPQVIPVVVKILATKLIAGITVGAIVKVAAAYAINRILNKSKGKGLGSGSGSQLTMSRDPSPARRIVYGETRASGPISFIHVSGNKNSTLGIAIMLAAHECDQIGAYLVEDVQVTPDETGAVTSGKYAGKLWINAHLGDQTTGDAGLIAMSGGAWTTAHALKGITYIACRLTYDTEVYAGGLPNFSVIMRGKRVLDPRTSITAFSRNPALILLDYLTNETFGLGATAGEIDTASFIAAANICDEGVTLAGGGTEPRYRCDGTFTTDAEPAVVIEQILATMAGSLVYAGGKFRCHAGAYVAPTITLDEGDLRGPIQFQPAAGIREVCNIVKGSYTSPVDLYQPRDIPQFRDSAHITADGEEIPADLDLAWVSSASQAQRLAKIHERASRLGGVLTLQCNLSALRVQAGDTIAVNNTRFGWDPKVFRVQECKFSVEAGGALGVDLICRETAASIWEWAAATDEHATDPAAEVENPDIDYSDMVGIGDTTGTPGTYDDLNGGTGGSTPEGIIAVQSRGGTWSYCGYTPYDGVEDSPPLRYRTETPSGTVVRKDYDTQHETLLATRTDTPIGPRTWVGCTEPTAGLWQSVQTAGGYCEAGTSGIDEPPSTAAAVEVGHLVCTYTNTCGAIGNGLGCCGNALGWCGVEYCGNAARTLSNPDTPDAAIARMLATAEWGAATTAIRTVPATWITGLYREARYRTEHTAGDPAVTTPTLIGLVPWQRYRLTVTLESRPVDEAGTPTGDGSWSAAGTRQHYFIADITGEGGIDWQVVEPTAGYETRVTSTLLEVA